MKVDREISKLPLKYMAILHRVFIVRSKRRKFNKRQRFSQNPNYLNILSSKNLKLVLPGRVASFSLIKRTSSTGGIRLKSRKTNTAFSTTRRVFKQPSSGYAACSPSINARPRRVKGLNVVLPRTNVKEAASSTKFTGLTRRFIEKNARKISSDERRSLESQKAAVTLDTVMEEYKTKKWRPWADN